MDIRQCDGIAASYGAPVEGAAPAYAPPAYAAPAYAPPAYAPPAYAPPAYGAYGSASTFGDAEGDY
jgi:hypothetical protein